MTFVEACRAWIDVEGKLPLTVSFLFEGEEESGSASLPGFLKEAAAELACDVVLVCDSDMFDPKTPAVTTRLRGFVAEEIRIRAADRDLHSGMFGNAAANAMTVLTDILASLRDPDGGIAVSGFYDDVAPLPADTAEAWAALPFDGKQFLSDIGLTTPAGEKDRSVLEQLWVRPSCEIHGIWGGYSGPGYKTVIPLRGECQDLVPAGQWPGPGAGPCSLPRPCRGPAAARLPSGVHGPGLGTGLGAGAGQSLHPARSGRALR